MAELVAFANSPRGPKDPRVEHALPLAVSVDDFDFHGQRDGKQFRSLMDVARMLPWMGGARGVSLVRKGWSTQLGAVLTQFARPLDEKQKFRLTTQLVTWDDAWLYFVQRFCVADQTHATVFCQLRFERSPEHPVLTEESLAHVQIENAAAPQPDDEMREWIALHGIDAERAWNLGWNSVCVP